MEIYMMDLFTRNMVSFPFLEFYSNSIWVYLWYWSHGWIFNGYR